MRLKCHYLTACITTIAVNGENTKETKKLEWHEKKYANLQLEKESVRKNFIAKKVDVMKSCTKHTSNYFVKWVESRNGKMQTFACCYSNHILALFQFSVSTNKSITFVWKNKYHVIENNTISLLDKKKWNKNF